MPGGLLRHRYVFKVFLGLLKEAIFCLNYGVKIASEVCLHTDVTDLNSEF